MLFRPHPGTRKTLDLITGIAPVYRIDPDSGKPHLIGTGFWVTRAGHLITARHVIDENIGDNGIDRGPIFAIQTFVSREVAIRVLRRSHRHPEFDLALSETSALPDSPDRPTSPMPMSLDEFALDDRVFSFAVQADDIDLPQEALPGHTAFRFVSTILFGDGHAPSPISFVVRLSFGHVREIFEQMRDRVMLPFPCVQSDVPIYGGNSGGPLFDIRGRVRAVNCTSFGGNEIAFHVPIEGILQLRLDAASLGIADKERKQRTILELATTRHVSFEPPMLNLDRLAWSIVRWIRYVIACWARGEWPAKVVHFATARDLPQSKLPRRESSDA